jgi:hypothetical protein
MTLTLRKTPFEPFGQTCDEGYLSHDRGECKLFFRRAQSTPPEAHVAQISQSALSVKPAEIHPAFKSGFGNELCPLLMLLIL